MVKNKKAGTRTQNQPLKIKKAPLPRWHLPFIFILTFAAYLPALTAGFVNWDDGDYVYNNILVKDISRLPELFITPVQGNHHPLTMFSLAINYLISGEKAWSYHLFNLVFHLINCFLVYRLALELSRNNSLIAFVTSLLFGIHPLHVESVAWVSERKDVLYGLFFIAGHITFTRYVDTGVKKFYWYTLLLAVLSLLSKPAAVIFPISLFCIDILRKRKLSFGLITEKMFFLIPAVIIGYLTVTAQKSAGAIEGDPFGMVKNILFGFYGLAMYFIKMILPLKQSAFYPFPPINENLTIEFYISPLFFLFLAILFFFSLKKYRAVSFGISFFIINLILVLQVFSVGSAVMAERYTYIPYIGMFYIVGYFLDRLAQTGINKAYFILTPLTLLFAIKTFMQAQTWKDGATLWESVIKNKPSSRAYSARATLFRKEKQYEKAIEYYSLAINDNKIDHESYNNRANIYMDLNKLDSAYIDYTYALSIKPDYYVSYDNIGALFARKGQYDSALFYLNKAIEMKPDYIPPYHNRGITLMSLQRYEEAIRDWKKVLESEPDGADIMNTIGLCLRILKRPQEALSYIDRAIQLQPQGPFFMNRSYTHAALNNFDQARKDALSAKQYGVPVPEAYAKSLGIQ